MNFKVLAYGLTVAALLPTIGASAAFAYAQAAFGFQLNSAEIVGGIFAISLLSYFVIRKWVQDFFKAMDTVPKLSSDVADIRSDISEIKDSVKHLLPWKEEVGKDLAVMRFRLEQLEKRMN